VGAGPFLCIYGLEIIGFGKWVAISKLMGYLVNG
jgi:hypothetical protein